MLSSRGLCSPLGVPGGRVWAGGMLAGAARGVWLGVCQYGGMADPRAGQPAAPSDLVNVAKLVTAYYTVHPDPGEVAQRVSFGTSGHRPGCERAWGMLLRPGGATHSCKPQG